MIVEALASHICALLLRDLSSQELRLFQGRGLQGLGDSFGKFLRGQDLVGNRRRTGSRPIYHCSPKRLVAEEWHDNRGLPSPDSCRHRPGPSVVDNARYALEEPVMRAVSNHKYPGGKTDIIGAKAAPALGDDGPHAGDVDRIKDEPRQGVGIVHDN